MTVIRGKARGNGAHLATYLETQGENDILPRVVDIRGTAAPHDLRKSLLEMSLTSELTKTDKGLWHLQINPMPGEDQKITDEQWLVMADITERHLGLEGQKRAMVEHVKNGRRHIHIAWERFDHEKEIMIDIKYSRLKQRSAMREIEQTLGLTITPMRNIKEADIKVQLTSLWTQTDGGKPFLEEAAACGYTVASGEGRRSFMVVDQDGRSFDLVRQLEGVRTKAVRESLAGQKLKTEKQVRKAIRQKQQAEAMNMLQDKAEHKIDEFRDKEKATAEQKKLYSDKLDMMKAAGMGMVNDSGDAGLTEKQDAATKAIEEFKQKQAKAEELKKREGLAAAMLESISDLTDPKPEEKPETDRERRLREFREDLQKGRDERDRNREHGFER